MEERESSNRNIADVRGKPKKKKKGIATEGERRILWMLSVLWIDEESVDEKAGRTVLCLFPQSSRRKGAEKEEEERKKEILKVREMLLWCRRLLLEGRRLLQ